MANWIRKYESPNQVVEELTLPNGATLAINFWPLIPNTKTNDSFWELIVNRKVFNDSMVVAAHTIIGHPSLDVVRKTALAQVETWLSETMANIEEITAFIKDQYE